MRSFRSLASYARRAMKNRRSFRSLASYARRAMKNRLYRLATLRDISRIREVKDEPAKALAGALAEWIESRNSAEESFWINRIEEIRNAMLDSDRTISFMDYGAGTPQKNRNTEQMNEGVVTQRTVGECCRSSSKDPFWCLFLFKLVEAFKPKKCLELGTSVGISAAYQSAALELNQQGSLLSLEGGKSLAELAKENLKQLGLHRGTVIVGRFKDTLTEVLHRLGHVDFAFIDGHHDEMATRAYFEQIKPHLSDGAVVVFDDVTWSPGMARAWVTIKNDTHVSLSVDLGNVGLCITSVSPSPNKRQFSVRV
jgi:predicted O-methyltransferase YrrM